MAAPAAAWTQLPLDISNTGKKIRTQTRVVGADTVHEHFVALADAALSLVGMYMSHSGNLTIQATAQNGTSTGFLWVINPAGSTILAVIERIKAITANVTALAIVTTPRVIGQLFTYTGTPSGATLTNGKTDSTYPAQQSSVRTASTGMTITLGAAIWSTVAPAAITAIGIGVPFRDEYTPFSQDDVPVLRTGEGIAFYQPDAGTTSDTRRLTIDLNIEEIQT